MITSEQQHWDKCILRKAEGVVSRFQLCKRALNIRKQNFLT